MDLSSLVIPPAYPYWAYPPSQYPNRHLGRHASSITPLSFHEPELNADSSGGFNYANRDTNEPQDRAPPLRRLSFSRHPRQGMQDTNNQQRRSMFRPANGSAPIPELVPLSRSNRRSFDRYSNDVQNDASGSNGSVRPLSSRAAGGFFSILPCTTQNIGATSSCYAFNLISALIYDRSTDPPTTYNGPPKRTQGSVFCSNRAPQRSYFGPDANTSGQAETLSAQGITRGDRCDV